MSGNAAETPRFSGSGDAPRTPALAGLSHLGPLRAGLSSPELVEWAVRRGEGQLTSSGALVAFTGNRTGRSPQDKFFVREQPSASQLDWGKVNQPLEPAVFDRLQDLCRAYLQGRETFVFDGYACAEPTHRLRLRVVAEKAWHALFARCLFLRLTPDEERDFEPEWTIVHAADLRLDPARDGTRSEVAVAISFERKRILVAGTHYAGEIKKGIFTVLNYLLPQRGVFPMHCAANVGAGGDVALFFGLSGTGKTTLSADPERRLIGDDEHGWSDAGIFNLEGGCYAKTIRLSAVGEPQIWNAIRFGCVLENVPTNPKDREPDYASEAVTENTRAAYPVDFIPYCETSGRGGHPRHVFFLTCDAFGVLPPLSRLSPEQAMYHFLSGYTAKVAGTEAGVTEPEATFSACFAAPFLPLPPTHYAEMLREKMARHQVPVWLVNTGWSGGPYGVGKRFPLAHTRALLRAALTGQLNDVSYEPDPVFGLMVPKTCPGVPPAMLRPRDVWADGSAYDAHARQLAELFRRNFERYPDSPESVRRAGPTA